MIKVPIQLVAVFCALVVMRAPLMAQTVPPPHVSAGTPSDSARSKDSVRSYALTFHEESRSISIDPITHKADTTINTMRGTILSDDFGRRRRVSMHLVAGKSKGRTTKSESTTIILYQDSTRTLYDSASNTAIQDIAPSIPGVNLTNGLLGFSVTSFALEGVGDQPGFRDLGTRLIAGKPAHGVASDSGGTRLEAWHWKGLEVRTEYSQHVDGFFDVHEFMTVDSLDTNVMLPIDAFTIPADATVVNLTSPDMYSGGTAFPVFPQGATTPKRRTKRTR